MAETRYQEEIEAFGRQFRKIRKSKGFTQLDIEVMTGINRTEVSRIENGLKNIEFFTLVKLAMAVNVPLKELFRYT